jgi:hypothetical protein
MGHEYTIKFQPPDRERWDAFVATLSNPIADGWAVFTIEPTTDGVYFCDHLANKEAAAITLRQIIDEARCHNDTVVIEET